MLDYGGDADLVGRGAYIFPTILEAIDGEEVGVDRVAAAVVVRE